MDITWKKSDGIPKKVVVGQRSVWGISMAEDIFKKTSGKWVKVPGKLKDISVGVNAVWGANKLNDIYMKTENSGWKRITGKLMQVRVVII